MAFTFKAIATVTVGSGGASTIDFTSIPATYTDLLIKISSRDGRSATGTNIIINFNGSNTNLSYRRLTGNGTSAGSNSGTGGVVGYSVSATATTDTFSNLEIYIPNYTSANYKSCSSDAVNENNATSSFMALVATLWSDTSAITSISLFPTVAATNFVQYTTATLYGIKNS